MNVSSGSDRSLLKDKSLQETVEIKQLQKITSKTLLHPSNLSSN